MSIEEFIISVFCFIDDLYQQEITRPLSTRERKPKLSDSEVITMEIVGEWMGRHTDKGIWDYFMQHWLSIFPNIPTRP